MTSSCVHSGVYSVFTPFIYDLETCIMHYFHMHITIFSCQSIADIFVFDFTRHYFYSYFILSIYPILSRPLCINRFNNVLVFAARACTASEFRCGNKDCIHKSKYCDSFPDCTDDTDEDFCSKSYAYFSHFFCRGPHRKLWYSLVPIAMASIL